MNRKDVLNLKDPPNSLGDQCINAGIIAGSTFFSSLIGLGIAGLFADPIKAVIASAVAAGASFFGSLMAQRGLQKQEA